MCLGSMLFAHLTQHYTSPYIQQLTGNFQELPYETPPFGYRVKKMEVLCRYYENDKRLLSVQ